MNARFRRAAAVVPAALATFAGAAVLAPAVGSAAGCGPRTVWDAPSNMCVVAAAPAGWDAAPPPPAPAPPIPFVATCFPVN